MSKDYYKISTLSEDFRSWLRVDLEGREKITTQTEVQIWQAQFMLAIAQQLSVIASHLGKIVGKAEDKQ